MRKLLLIMFGMSLFNQLNAFPCYITMVKNTCWTDYNVNVDVIDLATNKVVAAMSMPVGKSWDRREFSCEPQQTVMLQATYSPSIWEKESGKIYYGKHEWSFPEKINKGEGAWNMTLCFSNDLQEVPLPPKASGQCVCDLKNIPKIEPR